MGWGFVQLWLAVSLIMALPTLLVVFSVRPGQRRAQAQRSFPQVLVSSVVAALLALDIAAWLHASAVAAVLVGVITGAAVLLCWPATKEWAIRGQLAWALCLNSGSAYLTYVVVWMSSSGLSPLTLTANLLLFMLVVCVFVVGLGYCWEFLELMARRTPQSSLDPRPNPMLLSGEPFVSLHVPTHNERPEVVLATLTRLLQMDYTQFEVLVIDANTTDEQLWQPVAEFCAKHPKLRFFHIDDCPGHKSGSLNYALAHTPEHTEVAGVIDADYWVEPDFLKDCTAVFADPFVSYVVTAPDYRGWRDSAYFRRLYYAYRYFLVDSHLALVRKTALDAVGGWNERCLNENAELSLRLLSKGWSGLHLERSYGFGVLPLSFAALQRQRFRMGFGAVSLLRLHWRSLLPGRRTPVNRLSPAQRWRFLADGLQWFGDLAAVMFTGFLLVAAADAAFAGGTVVRRLLDVIVFSMVVLLGFGLLRALALVRRGAGASRRELLGAFGIWVSLSLTGAQAAARSLVHRSPVFLRAPQFSAELVLGGACLIAALLSVSSGEPHSVLLALLLTIQCVGYLAAPLNRRWARTAALSPDLEPSRQWTLSSWIGPQSSGIGAALALACAGSVLMLSAAPIERDSTSIQFEARDPISEMSPYPLPTPSEAKPPGKPQRSPMPKLETPAPPTRSVSPETPSQSPTSSAPGSSTPPPTTQPKPQPSETKPRNGNGPPSKPPKPPKPPKNR